MATWDRGVILWTIIGLVIIIPLLFAAPPLNNVFIWILPKETYLYIKDWFLEGVEGYFASGLFFSVIFLTYLFSPRGFLVDIHYLLIKRLGGGISISYSSIHDIRIVENVQLLVRLLGVGGIFSWYGTFLNGNGNKVKVYATNLKQLVRIQTTNGRIYYLSPAEREKFVEAVKRHLNQNH